MAGPIVRYDVLDEQIARREHTLEKFARGVALVRPRHGQEDPARRTRWATSPTPPSPRRRRCALDAWFGVFAYAFQIYFDFSGYSDMAVGLGRMFGFVIPKNFDSPYLADSITDFWRRWHICLSTWLRDYLYIPLGGNRKGPRRTYVNLAIVMLLGGLWHGATWNFVIWGPQTSQFVRLFMRDDILQAVERPERIAQELGITTAQLAIAWVLRQPNVASAIVGASRPEQVDDNVAASGVELPPDALLRIDEALSGVQPLALPGD